MRHYHFSESETQVSSENADSMSISETDLRDWKKKKNLMERAIKQAKEYSRHINSETNKSFYERYKFNHHGSNIIELNGNPEFFMRISVRLKKSSQYLKPMRGSVMKTMW